MTTKKRTLDEVLQKLNDLADKTHSDREKRWRPFGSVYYERGAIAALMTRQYKLFCYFLRSPIFWDGLLGPSLLRMMIENIITVEWICVDLDRRCAMYVDHGIGQARLMAENLRKHLAENGPDDFATQVADVTMAWVENQKLLAFVDINLGHWADKNLRVMADETKLEGLHRFGFLPFSAAVHGTWNHTGIHDVRSCQNLLHKRHMIGSAVGTTINEDYLFRACKFFDLFFDCIDRQMAIRRHRKSMRNMFLRNQGAIARELRKMFGRK